MRRASSSGLGDEKPWVKAQASKEKAEIAALQQTVEFLSAEAQASREWRAEGRAAIDGLRTDVAGLRSELKFTCGRLERALDELKTSTSQQLASQRGELQVAVNELAALKTQVALLTNGLEVAQASLHEHGGHLKDVAVLKAQHGFLQGAAERGEVGRVAAEDGAAEARAHERLDVRRRVAALEGAVGRRPGGRGRVRRERALGREEEVDVVRGRGAAAACPRRWRRSSWTRGGASRG